MRPSKIVDSLDAHTKKSRRTAEDDDCQSKFDNIVDDTITNVVDNDNRSNVHGE